MSSDLLVPQPIEDIIQRFNNDSAPFAICEVQSALAERRPTLQGLSEAEQRGVWAEILAFALVSGDKAANPWGTHFGPIATLVRDDGTEFYRPDIEGTEPVTWSHWCHRAEAVTQPMLKARYADLAWDMAIAVGKQQRRTPKWAIVAVDAYLTSLSATAITDDFEQFSVAIRALDLAIQVGDISRIDRARYALIDLHREALAKEHGLWWRAFDRLIADRRTRTLPEELDPLVADLETLLARFSDTANPSRFNPHAAEQVAKRLQRHYSRRQSPSEAKRVHGIIGRTFEHFAGLGDAMLASTVLQTSVNAYRQAGLADDAERARILMQEKIGQMRGEMKRFETALEVPREDVEKFLAAIVTDQVGSTFARIASNFVPHRNALEMQVKDTLKHAPLMARIGQEIVSDDRVVAKVGSVEDDLHGRIIQHAFTLSGLETFWLAQALGCARKRHDLFPEHIVAWANGSKLFSDVSLLLEGVDAWFDGDIVKAVHVLVPQVELALRKIVEQLGKPTTKPHPGIPGASVVVGMGDMLYGETAVTEALGPDLVLYFLVRYADPLAVC
jgi:lysyl-tRNA synthetase, class I